MKRNWHPAESPAARGNARIRILFALVSVLALLGVAYFLGGDRHDPGSLAPPQPGAEPDRGDRAPAMATAGGDGLAAADPVPVATPAIQDERRNLDVEPELHPEDVPLATAVDSEPQPGADEADLEATTSIRIRTVDPNGVPIEGARLRIWAMRSQRDPGAHYLYRGDAPTAVTDQLGIATLDHWVWTDLDGKTGQVTLSANHEDFPPFSGDVEIGTEVREIEMQWGATVSVTGWYEAPSRVVRDIAIQVDTEAGLPATAWQEGEDGALRTGRLSIGPHRIRIRHESEALGTLFSAVHDFRLEPGDWLELELELLPAGRFEGVLEARVPRPIVDGHVLVCLQGEGPRNSSPGLYRKFETAIEADGSFLFEALPPGRVQLVALCRGWVSEGIDDSTTPLTVPQWVAPHVVAMKPTGAIEIQVLDERGAPIPDAVAGASPNVRFVGVGASIFPWREWSATTDETGIARIEDLPPNPSLWVHASSATHRMRKEDRERSPSIEVRPGQTSRVTLRLEPGD